MKMIKLHLVRTDVKKRAILVRLINRKRFTLFRQIDYGTRHVSNQDGQYLDFTMKNIYKRNQMYFIPQMV